MLRRSVLSIMLVAALAPTAKADWLSRMGLDAPPKGLRSQMWRVALAEADQYRREGVLRGMFFDSWLESPFFPASAPCVVLPPDNAVLPVQPPLEEIQPAEMQPIEPQPVEAGSAERLPVETEPQDESKVRVSSRRVETADASK